MANSFKEAIFKYFENSGESLSFVESCTGGGITEAFVQIPGASNFLKGGLVPYTDEIKSQKLGISLNLIKDKTAVSEEVVKLMASNGREFFSADWCLATSGWTGPGGGTAANPVGTIYFAVSGPGLELVERRTFKGSNSREILMEQGQEFAWKFFHSALPSNK